MILSVRKLVSENPTVYRDEPLSIMLKDYHVYILNCIQQIDIVPKEFEDWLNTEI